MGMFILDRMTLIIEVSSIDYDFIDSAFLWLPAGHHEKSMADHCGNQFVKVV